LKKISISEEAYWKLKEMQARLRCSTWNELVEELWTQQHYANKTGPVLRSRSLRQEVKENLRDPNSTG